MSFFCALVPVSCPEGLRSYSDTSALSAPVSHLPQPAASPDGDMWQRNFPWSSTTVPEHHLPRTSLCRAVHPNRHLFLAPAAFHSSSQVPFVERWKASRAQVFNAFYLLWELQQEEKQELAKISLLRFNSDLNQLCQRKVSIIGGDGLKMSGTWATNSVYSLPFCSWMILELRCGPCAIPIPSINTEKSFMAFPTQSFGGGDGGG